MLFYRKYLLQLLERTLLYNFLNGEAGLTGEGQSYSETEPEYGYLTITKVKVTAYTEITEELEKLPALP